MSTRGLSPTAQLLRTSRLFSLPPALPAPTEGLSNKSHSESATLPYPTRQAITTSDTLRRRGDWGLKRPLPKNATTTVSQQPTIRVIEADTAEQVTDFESANDHNRTLLKWQEMNVPMMFLKKRTTVTGALESNPGQSVFNALMDNTSRERAAAITEKVHRSRSDRYQQYIKAHRWKFGGPSITDMSEGDFSAWLAKVIGKPEVKREFTKWLRKRLVADEIAGMRSRHRADAVEGPFDEADARAKLDVEQLISDRLQLLRGKQGSAGSDLNRYIEEFLDLPPRTGTTDPRAVVSLSGEYTHYTTHPSAGLSYLRNKSFIPNHPLLGPRADHEPVRARQLNVAGTPVVGVGGVAAIDPSNTTVGGDYDTYGGRKKWVTPLLASINEEGKIRLRTGISSATSVQVKQDDIRERMIRRGEMKDERPLRLTPTNSTNVAFGQ